MRKAKKKLTDLSRLTLSVDEYFEINEPLKLLRKNIEANVNNYRPAWTDDERQAFVRLQLIIIRQSLEQLGEL